MNKYIKYTLVLLSITFWIRSACASSPDDQEIALGSHSYENEAHATTVAQDLDRFNLSPALPETLPEGPMEQVGKPPTIMDSLARIDEPAPVNKHLFHRKHKRVATTLKHNRHRHLSRNIASHQQARKHGKHLAKRRKSVKVARR